MFNKSLYKTLRAFLTLVMASLAALLLAGPASGQSQSQTIDAAVTPLPAAMKNGAAVVRLDAYGQPETLRDGTNGLVCIADKPGDAEFDVRCYRDSFIHVVYRNFQLKASGSSTTVAAEITAGQLKLSNEPTAGYRCLGPANIYDASTKSVIGTEHCWESLHFPFRTAQEVGFPDMSEVPENLHRMVPYIMASGTYWAHVMIEHPASK
jgi:hypothetical protein